MNCLGEKRVGGGAKGRRKSRIKEGSDGVGQGVSGGIQNGRRTWARGQGVSGEGRPKVEGRRRVGRKKKYDRDVKKERSSDGF